MSNYNLSLTGAQVNSALNKVHNADIEPTNGSENMITSNAVHDAVNDIQFANLNSNLTSTDLSSGTNNNTIPTTQAVANLFGGGVKLARYSCTVTNQSGNLFVFPFVEDYDPDGIGSVSSGVITLVPGNYYIHFTSSIQAVNRTISVEKNNGTYFGYHNTRVGYINSSTSSRHQFNCGAIVAESSNFTIRAIAYYGTSGYLNAHQTYFNIMKFS